MYGNLNEKSFIEIWQSQRAKDILKKVSENPDFKYCDTLCRSHNINKFLWELNCVPQHVNFI